MFYRTRLIFGVLHFFAALRSNLSMKRRCCKVVGTQLSSVFLLVSRLTSQSSPFKVVFPLNYSFANRETCTKQTSQCSGFQAVKSDVKLDRTDTLVIQACFEAEFLRFEFVWMLL